MATSDTALEKGLPVNLDAERFILGSILLDDSLFVQVAGALSADEFALEKHRRIFSRMADLYERGERIDRVTVAEELMKHNQLESCDGLSYLVSLDDGLPQTSNLDSYIRIVKDKATLRKIIFSAQKLIDRCLMGDEEPSQILATAEESLLKLSESRLDSGLMTPRQVIESYQGGVNAFLDPTRRIKGISTGFVRLDEMTGGLHPGELIILAARPSMGKTAMALNIAHHVAAGRNPQTVAIFSLEMSKESLLTRLLCAAARVDSQKFRAGYLNAEERRRLSLAASQLIEAPLFIDDTPSANLMDMHAKLRRLKAEHGLALAVIDYLQLMTGRGRFENRTQEISSLSRGLKMLAKELDVPLLVLSQLSRAPEVRQGDHRPQLSDLRESGCLTGDTLIPVPAGGRIPIRELAGKAGFHVWALNEQTMKLEPAAVSRAFSTGIKPVFELRTRLGRIVRATGNHMFRTFTGWKRLDALVRGDHIALPRIVPGGSTQTMTGSELALLGHLIGDGCTLPRHVLQYTTRERDLAELVAKLAAGVFGGEIAPRIRAWLAEHPGNTNRDIIPRQVWGMYAAPAMREQGLSTRAMMAALGTAYCGTSIYRQNVSRERAARLADVIKSQEIRALSESDIYWDQVDGITPAGSEEVYDLTVPGRHNFVAGDIVVHNSIEQDADVVGFIFREEVYKPDREDLRGLAELILAKQRNGPTGKINLVFLRHLTKFENLTSDLGDESEAPPPGDADTQPF